MADGSGEVLVEDGGLLETVLARLGSIGEDPLIGTGIAKIRGDESLWTVEENLVVDGLTGTQLIVDDHARVAVGDIGASGADTEFLTILTVGADHDGVLQVRDDAMLKTGPEFVGVGTKGGTGELLIESGGRFSGFVGLTIGAADDGLASDARVVVRGSSSAGPSTLRSVESSVSSLGLYDGSSLRVEDGGQVAINISALYGEDAVPSLVVDGPASAFHTNSMDIGLGYV